MSASMPSIEDLASRHWGQVNKTLSSKAELRFGTNGSKSVKLKDRTWFDHEAGKGGGYAELHEAVLGVRPADASIIAAYDYHDAAGNLVHQVVRKEGKKFVQRRPDGNGGWLWNMQGVARVPYRLPDLLRAAPDAAIYICEGEKDVDALRDRMLVATTNAGGAGKWEAAFSEHFRGRHVVILPDNDEAGEKHAADVQRKLAGVCASIRVVRLPDLPAKGDVSDWIAVGGTAEALALLASIEDSAPESADGLADFLSVETWASRDLPEPDRLLGDLVTSDSRVFLVGTTGLGKTMFGFGLALGMAAGTGFLHWRSKRPARVVYIDGEMSSALVKARSFGELRRAAGPIAGALTIYARDFDEQTERAFPQLGKMPPLNTIEGHDFVHRLIQTTGGADVVIFDNVMSLLNGDMKEEESWTNTLPLIAALSANRIGQVWFDHTGHNTARQYGSSTKAWRFDAVGVMTPLPEDDRGPGDLAFQLSFEPPGKARRRTPDNWADFAPCTVRLVEDQWTSEQKAGKPCKGKVSPVAQAFHHALMDALATASPPGQTTRDAWYVEGVRLGLLDPYRDSDDRDAKDRKRSKLRKYMTELKAAGWIGVDGETVRDLTSSSKCRTTFDGSAPPAEPSAEPSPF